MKFISEGHSLQNNTTSSADETRSKSHENSSFNTSTTPQRGTDVACFLFVLLLAYINIILVPCSLNKSLENTLQLKC